MLRPLEDRLALDVEQRHFSVNWWSGRIKPKEMRWRYHSRCEPVVTPPCSKRH